MNGEKFPQSYGYVDLNNKSVHADIDKTVLPTAEAFKIVEKVLNDILRTCPDDSDLLNWVTKLKEQMLFLDLKRY